MSGFVVGQRVSVRAWWRNGRRVLCEVYYVPKTSDAWIEVDPGPGEHIRMVSVGDVVVDGTAREARFEVKR